MEKENKKLIRNDDHASPSKYASVFMLKKRLKN